nr:hypothetical protein CFP56_14487 [Quercus suber]
MESDETIPTDIECEGKDITLDAQPDEVAGLPPAKKAKTELKVYKRRGSSTVWRYFKVLPTKEEGKPTCKCKKCGKEFIAARANVTENLKRHLDWACPRKFDVPLSIPVSAGADIAPIGATFLKQRSAQKKNVGPSVGSSKRPRVQSIAGDVHAEESPVDPTAAVADDGDNEVHVDGAAAEPTIPPPHSIRAMMETFMTTQAVHGQLLNGLIA